MAEAAQKFLICLLIAGILLAPGCTNTPPTITQLPKNTSAAGQAYPQYSGDVPLETGNGNQAKNETQLPPLPPLPSSPQQNQAQNSSLLLTGIYPKQDGVKLAAVGAVASAWAGDGENGSKYYYLKAGESATLADGTKLELASLNDDWSRGGVWATYVIGGARKTANVGDTAEAGAWTVRTIDLFVAPEKVYAVFNLTDFGGEKAINATVGSKIYASGSHIYEVSGVYSGYTGNYSAAILSEDSQEYAALVGEELPLPLGQAG